MRLRCIKARQSQKAQRLEASWNPVSLRPLRLFDYRTRHTEEAQGRQALRREAYL